MSDLDEAIATRITELRSIVEKTNPGPWFYNGYSGIFSGPMVKGYDDWLDPLVDQEHTLEKYGVCSVCGDWRGPDWGGSPGLGHGCQRFGEYYDRDPLVAHVPAHHGDTAIRKRQADAEFIEAFGPDVMASWLNWAERVALRHQAYRQSPGDQEREVTCRWCLADGESHLPYPCPDLLDLALALGVQQ